MGLIQFGDSTGELKERGLSAKSTNDDINHDIGPQIWNALPNELKSADNLKNFKNLIK